MNNSLFAINVILKTQLWVLLKIYTLVNLNIFLINQRIQQQT